MPYDTINDRIVQLREALSLSQLEFANRIGITQGALSQLESGKSKTSVTTISKIFRTFEINCNWLIAENGNMFLNDHANGIEIIKRNVKASELIPLVREEAHAGYISNCADHEYIDLLDVYKIPGYEKGHYRLFEIEGDSMLPTIQPREIVVGELNENLKDLENGSLCVLVTEEGIVAKRVYFSEDISDSLILKSDNPNYQTYAINQNTLVEIWIIKAKITSHFAADEPSSVKRIEGLESDIRRLQQQMEDILNQRLPGINAD